MVMDTLQIRLTKGLILEIQKLVDKDIYSSVSEAVRDAVRRFVSGESSKNRGDAVKHIQEQIVKEVKSKLEVARGTRDFLPENQIVRDQIMSVLRETFELYGFSPLETPILEREDVLASKYAGGAEILKEMFSLKDQGNRALGLRYDLTVPLARVIGMNPQLKMPFKRYQIGHVFRDGPVSFGRYRQFMQCDVDVVGCASMTADAEIIALTFSAFRKLGFEINLRVNNRKILNAIIAAAGISADEAEAAILSIDKLEKFGKNAVVKELGEKGIGSDAIEKLLSTIGVGGSNEEKLKTLKRVLAESEGLEEMRSLLAMCKVLGCSFTFDPSLARGLAYYTGTIYETFLKDSRITSAVCSGGRYDEIIGNFLGKGSVPAVGISFGLDRIYDALLEREKPKAKTVTQVFVLPIGTLDESMKIAQELRKEGIKVEIDLLSRGISKNLNYANAVGIPYVIFIGQKELKDKKVKLKNMESGEEGLYSMKDVIGSIR